MIQLKHKQKLGMVIYAYNPITLGAEEGGSQALVQPEQQSKTLSQNKKQTTRAKMSKKFGHLSKVLYKHQVHKKSRKGLIIWKMKMKITSYFTSNNFKKAWEVSVTENT